MPKPQVASRRDAVLLANEAREGMLGANDPRIPQKALTGLKAKISRSITPTVGSTRKKLGF